MLRLRVETAAIRGSAGRTIVVNDIRHPRPARPHARDDRPKPRGMGSVNCPPFIAPANPNPGRYVHEKPRGVSSAA
jgi:hypothetical protein